MLNIPWLWMGCTSALFVGMLLLLKIGWRLGRRQTEVSTGQSRAGLSGVDGSVYGLLGLMIALTASGAANRFDDRRKLIVEETNAIGTAWLRIDLLPADHQAKLRQCYRDYLDARLGFYSRDIDDDARQAQLVAAQRLQAQLWTEALAGCQALPDPRTASTLLLPAINQMFDAATARMSALQRHPPTAIFVFLFALALVCSFLVGHAMSESEHPHRLHGACFAALISLAIYMILDFEHPRLGLVRTDSADQLLFDLRTDMK